LQASQKRERYVYDLIANVCYDPKQSVYKVHVKNRATDQWYEIQDLYVQEIHPQTIFLSEVYIQVSLCYKDDFLQINNNNTYNTRFGNENHYKKNTSIINCYIFSITNNLIIILFEAIFFILLVPLWIFVL
jgi:hypothetical protein